MRTPPLRLGLGRRGQEPVIDVAAALRPARPTTTRTRWSRKRLRKCPENASGKALSRWRVFGAFAQRTGRRSRGRRCAVRHIACGYAAPAHHKATCAMWRPLAQHGQPQPECRPPHARRTRCLTHPLAGRAQEPALLASRIKAIVAIEAFVGAGAPGSCAIQRCGLSPMQIAIKGAA